MKLLTEKMTLAHIGVHIKNLARKIAKSEDVVALSSINGQHVVLECLNISFRLQMVQYRIQSEAKLAAMKLARLDVIKEQCGALQLVVSLGKCQLTLSTIRNKQSAQRMVVAA